MQRVWSGHGPPAPSESERPPDMITIRAYRESDAPAVGRLIADTYSEYNLDFLPPEDRDPFLGPFRHAYSPDEAHQKAIARTIWSETVLLLTRR